jgi:hypothetical protein
LKLVLSPAISASTKLSYCSRSSGSGLVVAGLEPGDGHVDRLAVGDRRDGVEERELGLAGERGKGVGEGRGGQGTGRHDNLVPFLRRQPGDLAALDRDERVRFERRRDRVREAVAVDRERSAGRHLMGVALGDDQRAQGAHLLMQQPDRVRLGVVGAEGVRADELGKAAGLVGFRAAPGPHLVQHHRHAGAGDLPGGFGARKAAADDVDGLGHAPDIGERPDGIKRIETPASARRALCQTRRRSGAGMAARDAVDLEPGDAEVVELAIGELRQLAHRLAIGEIGADLREDHGHEHGGFLFSWAFPRTGKALITQGRELHAAMHM